MERYIRWASVILGDFSVHLPRRSCIARTLVSRVLMGVENTKIYAFACVDVRTRLAVEYILCSQDRLLAIMCGLAQDPHHRTYMAGKDCENGHS